MKRRIVFGFSLTAVMTATLFVAIFSNTSKNAKKVEGYSALNSLPTTIDLTPTSASTIRSYYSSLNNLSDSERQGTNLLKNLKDILKNGQKYLNYDSGNTVWQLYEISDRDWDKSPAESITNGTYNSTTKKITGYTYGTSTSNKGSNPYVHALYVNRNVDNQVRAWDDHQQTQWGINREHVWAKAEGFDEGSGGGARGDPFHLMAGNGYANNIHSNYYFGYVKTSSSYTNCGTKYSNLSGNLSGTSKTLNTGTVFEPQDCDKGDIARAIFYMAARYNYLSGSDSDGIDSNNPNLALTQSISDWSKTAYESSTTRAGKMGVLTDLLAWHHADPVDEFEIRRNNILYTNYTKNRNPFIDFPEWVDFIWGTAVYNGTTYKSYSSTPTGYATPSSDTINGYNSSSSVSVADVSLNESSATLTVGDTLQLTATVSPSNATNKNVTWSSSNTTYATVSNSGLVTAKKAGSATITVTTQDGSFTDTCTLTINSATVAVTGVTLNENSLTLTENSSDTLIATVVPSNATNKSVTWTSSNTSVATVSSGGVVTAVSEGSATITVRTADGNRTATCSITVKPVQESIDIYTLYKSDITEGDYVIAYGNSAMKNTIDSNRLTYSEITITDGTVDNVTDDIAWHISQSGNYWTIYNASVDKYAASTGAANKAQLTTTNDDKILWTISGNSTYEFVNKYNQAQSVNCNLRNNGAYGFACYSTSTGGALSLYKKTTIINPDHVSSVSLNAKNMSISVGGTSTLQTTIYPSTALDKTVEWDSSDYSIVDVDSSGKIEAISSGTATITVTTNDGGFTDTCVVSVYQPSLTNGSPYINGAPYKMFFNNTGSGSNKGIHYFDGEMSGYYGRTVTTKSDGVDVYFEPSGEGQNIYFYDSDNVRHYIYVYINGSYSNFKYDLTTAPEIAWVYNSTYETMTYTISSTAYGMGSKEDYGTVGVYEISSVSYKIQFETTDGCGSAHFAVVLNNYIKCNSNGTSAPTYSGFSWNEFNDVYDNLDSLSQGALASASGNESGTHVERFVARYDYIVGKYGYTDFLGRNPSPIGNHRINNLIDTAKSGNYMIIIIAGVMSIASLASFFIVRKKKEK